MRSMCEQVHAELRSLSVLLQNSEGYVSATPVSEFASPVLEDDILWQHCHEATDEQKRSYPKSRTLLDVPATT